MATDNADELQTISSAKRALNDGAPTRDAFEGKKGTITFSGTGAQTAFNIPHGLGVAPAQAFASPVTVAASALHTVTKTSTNIVITFAAAPANAVDNIVIDWLALY
jgi:hypothetical protein